MSPKLDKEKTIHFFIRLLFAVNYLHSINIIYRDLHPRNLLINHDFELYMSDFGTIRLEEDKSPLTKNICLSVYSPKEFFNSSSITSLYDSYSLGQLLYFLKCKNHPNKTPFSTTNEQVWCDLYHYLTCKISERYNTFLAILYLFSFKLFPKSFKISMFFFPNEHQIQFFYFFVNHVKDSLNNKDGNVTLLSIFNENYNQESFFCNNHLYCFLGLLYKNEFLLIDADALRYQPNIKSSEDFKTYNDCLQLRNGVKQYFFYNYNVKYISSNISQAINYFKIAAKFNNPTAQYNLGLIYFADKYIPRDIHVATHYFELAAKQNHPTAQFYLGIIHFKIEFGSLDIEKAKFYFELASRQNHVEATFYLGIIYIFFDINKGIHYLNIAANQNHRDSQFMLGVIFLQGQLIPIDLTKSIHYFTLAANQNHAEAQFQLGVIYYYDTVPRDIGKAIYYFELAAKQNALPALNNLGMIFYYGESVPQDFNKAFYYFELASKQNEPTSLFHLGRMFLYNQVNSTRGNLDKAIFYFELAAQQNNSEALFFLGLLNYTDEYMPHEINKAIYYFELASNQNHSKSQFLLGKIYFESKFVVRDIEKSIHYFELSANQGHYNAQFYMGFIYFTNKYVPQDIQKAIYYFKLSSDQNYSEAQYYLGEIYFTNTIIQRDIEKSLHYFKLSADQNHSKSQFNLGLIYLANEVIPRDIKKSIYYFEMAAQQNHVEAQYNLGILYYQDDLVPRDINKAIYYLESAAKQNYIQAQLALGQIYGDNKFIPCKSQKSIYYFEAIAKQDASSQFHLGVIYYSGVNFSKTYRVFDYYNDICHMKKDEKQSRIISISMIAYYYIKQGNLGNAKELFSQIEKENNPHILNNLGVITYFMDKNLEKALFYFKKSNETNLFVLSEINLAIIYEIENNLEESLKHYYISISLDDNQSLFHELFPSESILALKTFCMIKLLNFHLNKIQHIDSEILNAILQNIKQQKYFRNIFTILNIQNPFQDLDNHQNINNENFDTKKIENISNEFMEKVVDFPYMYLFGFSPMTNSPNPTNQSELLLKNNVNEHFYQGFS
ncbi:hypothetical protein TRFO_23959 [Tritrichomonas foetus]|uniref:Protein kinase domain-containing protein n=1 Tax=Tritrichomonas foetus TaxID=1144522 RepID=A0A1J4KDH1_9EUKA|nr:hypothetical protein TRFO_23959 [Tritrichomonas foetus]|eukprot:OHT07764.1 hypothetical protein TRFO_23959 [Tritrichomonas foetus]